MVTDAIIKPYCTRGYTVKLPEMKVAEPAVIEPTRRNEERQIFLRNVHVYYTHLAHTTNTSEEEEGGSRCVTRPLTASLRCGPSLASHRAA